MTIFLIWDLKRNNYPTILITVERRKKKHHSHKFSCVLTRVWQRVEVSTQHQWNCIGLTRDRWQLEAACGLVHYALHLWQEHHGLDQLDVRVFWVPVHVGVGHQQKLLLHAVERLTSWMENIHKYSEEHSKEQGRVLYNSWKFLKSFQKFYL